MNILFSVNRGYIKHLKECIKSIVRFPHEDGYDFYIMHSDLGGEEKEELKALGGSFARFHYVYVDLDRELNFPESGRYPLQIYYRIFAALLLPDDLSRILYLDADITVINPLSELYNMDFCGDYMLACTHTKRALNRINKIRLGMKEECPYINSGVLLMNLELLRKEQDFKEVIEYVEKYRKSLILPDQDVITALYGTRIGLIDTMKYNLSDRTLMLYNLERKHEPRDLAWVRENTVIIHYFGKNKPWNKAYLGVLDVFYKELAEEG